MPDEYRLILKHIDAPGYAPDIDTYLRHDGYADLKKALALPPITLPAGAVLDGPARIRNEVRLSGLRGRGGAGFPAGTKWSFIDHKTTKPIYLICNADESEPGTFKDRQIIHKDPHQLLEGMIIACYANDVHLAYIYIRGEFIPGARLLQRALDEARAHHFLGPNILGSGYNLEIHIHRGAGAYICGEETGLIESLEGKRPYPRIKPPYYPAVLGLYGCPTIVNNVETLCAVKHVVAMGGAAYAQLGTPTDPGTRIVCVSGHVRKPGYFEIQIGQVTLGQLVSDFAGGLRDGRKLKAIIPGGSSAKILRAGEKYKLKTKRPDGREIEREVALLDLPYDAESLSAAGSMCGSAAVIVLDDSADMVSVLANISEFYAHESCGQCTPCREGSLWMSKALARLARGQGRQQDADYLLHIANNISGGRTICAFGEACAWPVQSTVAKFKDEFTG
ncbi:MAG: NADH-quinone oxidoreductase subunit NuoF [Candidatus Omnitrophica bacterium]|nr:NADH-quinone oxidoreductase subunit NuoF [Candidatus Omnitrophota bacterium]